MPIGVSPFFLPKLKDFLELNISVFVREFNLINMILEPLHNLLESRRFRVIVQAYSLPYRLICSSIPDGFSGDPHIIQENKLRSLLNVLKLVLPPALKHFIKTGKAFSVFIPRFAR